MNILTSRTYHQHLWVHLYSVPADVEMLIASLSIYADNWTWLIVEYFCALWRWTRSRAAFIASAMYVSYM